MTESAGRYELSAEDVRFHIAADDFGFADTRELKPLEEIIGQPRALEALDLGVGIRHQDYHVYAAGMTGTGKLDLLQKAVSERVTSRTSPCDWVFLNNFDEPDRPLAIALNAGEGVKLRDAMENLIETLVSALPKAFREEDFGKEKDRLRQEYRKRGEAVFQELERLAEEHNMTVKQLPDGEILFIPLKDGRPMSPEEVQQLTPEQIAELESHQEQLIQTAAKVLEQQMDIQKQLTSDVREVARQFARRLVEPLVSAIARQFDNDRLAEWFEALKADIIEHLDRFRETERMPAARLQAMMENHDLGEQQRFLDYQVNVLVDNSDRDRPPVIIENAPNYRNLFGTIERVVDRHGRVTTNFTRIKAGSLLRANGGFLVFDITDALGEPFVWKELKRTLKSGQVEIETFDPFSMFTVSAIKPDPIPLNVKLVAAGPPLIYHLLCLYDEDFSRVFRVKADFDVEITREADAGQLYGQFVRKLSDSEGLLPFSAHAVAELVASGARLTDDRRKISTEFTHVGDFAREADYWARRDGADVVQAEHVRTAVDKRIYRSNLIATKIRELIADGTLIFDLEGTAVGQINGLAVANLGDYSFGRPSRVTASVGIGAAGIINIERESRMSGRTYDKGMLIIEGFLRNRYAKKHPVTLSASLAMEQSYGGIDGDSASVTELLCLLSAIGGIPLRQDIAVTGSINQWGEIQAIGGVNEKIEGFFDVCREAGLTGTQGVCIPHANVKNLVLRPDVVAAIEEGQFHIWAVKTFDEAAELFTGLPAGSIEDSDTFHGKVADRLELMIDTLKKQPTSAGSHLLWTPGMPTGLPPDPRPTLPGDEGR
ncbi:ATP-binding protein [Maioricimonas sp. JC845]|uniref:Lon protease family protein n=1 Tax=Maioricimonas sp. JC845 TaxID=3232138 RepID=UPI00345852A2